MYNDLPTLHQMGLVFYILWTVCYEFLDHGIIVHTRLWVLSSAKSWIDVDVDFHSLKQKRFEAYQHYTSHSDLPKG
jgi:hypothetical protein